MAEELDLVSSEAAAPAGASYAPTTAPYDPSRQREHVRAGIAYALIGLLIAIILFSFGLLLFSTKGFDEVKGMLELVLAPVVGLVGAVTGFYYGEKSKS